MKSRQQHLRNVFATACKMFYKRIPYFVLFSLSLYVLIFLGVRSYYRFMPADWFVALRGIPSISNGAVDDTLTLTFCRDTRYPNIQAVGARSYYVILDGKQSPAGDYEFHARIEQNTECQYIPITADKHPSKAGTYLARTDLTFYVEGHRKVLSYQTDTFQLSDTRRSLEEQIDQLQQRIDELKSLQGVIKVDMPVADTAEPQPSRQVSTAAPPPSPIQPVTTPAPTTSAPPDPGIVQRVLTEATSLF